VGKLPEAGPGPATSTDAYGEDDLLSPDIAAWIAGRSVRTIRRAYSAGTLIAYRDGGGRGVRIRHADLRDWLLREPAATLPSEPTPAPTRPLGRVDPGRRHRPSGPSENLALLSAARRRRSGRDGAVGRRAEGPAPSSRA
jgi:hypothetical protein